MTKSFLDALSGNPVWPPPVWLMRQAGRYLPEYREIRANAGDFIALCMNPELAAEVTLQPIRRYGMDAAILFADILLIPWALGQGLRFAAGEGPVLPPIRSHAGLDALELDQASARLAPVMETVRRVKAGLDDKTALIGFAGSPFTVACYMVEGSGSRDFAEVRKLAYQQPDVFDRLIEILNTATVDYLSAQIDAGADTVMLFDSWAGVLPPALFRRYVIAPTKKIVVQLRAKYPQLHVIGFPRLAGSMLSEYVAETGVSAVGTDTSVNLAEAIKAVPANIAIQGNLDPISVVSGGPAMLEQTEAILNTMRGRPFIFNLGHGLVPETPPEHVAALIARVRQG